MQKIIIGGVIALLLVFLYWAFMVGNSAPTYDSSLATSTPESASQTTTPIPPTVTPPATVTPKAKAVAAPMPLVVKGIYQIYYLNTGFYPSKITIKAGTSVRFNNLSNKAMQIYTTEQHPDRFHENLKQELTVGKKGYYDYTFIDLGYFGYKNNNNANDTGVVVVVSQ